MLSSITPLGERGRNNRFAVAAWAFVVGSALGGAALGFAAGGVGALVVPDQPAVLASVIAAFALIGAAFDARLGGLRLPTIKRQVDENWLNKYRGWVYGFGYGVQLGTGLATIVSSAAVYVMVVAAVLTRSIVAATAIGLIFGVVRGTSIVLTRRVHTPEGLRRFHRRLAENASRSERVGVVTQGLVALAGLVVVVAAR
jgi:hypothetical protein